MLLIINRLNFWNTGVDNSNVFTGEVASSFDIDNDVFRLEQRFKLDSQLNIYYLILLLSSKVEIKHSILAENRLFRHGVYSVILLIWQ